MRNVVASLSCHSSSLAPGAAERERMLGEARRLQDAAWSHAAEGRLDTTDALIRVAARLERRALACDPRELRDQAANRPLAPFVRGRREV